MRCTKSKRRAGGFTLVEMLVVIAIIGILAALLLPALTGSKQRAKRIVCENQLQQIGIAFQSFSHDHNSKFPMQVSTNDGGSLEYFQSSNLLNGLSFSGYRNFQSLGGILASPVILVCPSDTRLPAANFTVLQNSNVSYFAGLTAAYDQPMSILAGDGNLTSSSTLVFGTAGGGLSWNRELHEFKGNVLFSDGHVEEWKDGGGNSLASATTIALPTLGGSGGGGGGGGSGGGGSGSSASQASQPPAPNSPAPMNSTVAQAGPAANQPATPTASPSAPRMLNSSSRQNMASAAAGQSDTDVSNPVVEDVAATTVSPDTNVSSPVDDNATMSPANRKIASVLRDFLAGSYLLVLLLLLLYAAYRIRRWRQEVERKRQLKLARSREISEWQP